MMRTKRQKQRDMKIFIVHRNLLTVNLALAVLFLLCFVVCSVAEMLAVVQCLFANFLGSRVFPQQTFVKHTYGKTQLFYRPIE